MKAFSLKACPEVLLLFEHMSHPYRFDHKIQTLLKRAPWIGSYLKSRKNSKERKSTKLQIDLQIPMKFHGNVCSYDCVVTPVKFQISWVLLASSRTCQQIPLVAIWHPCAKSRQSAMSSKSPLGLLSDSSPVLPLETIRNQEKCAKSHISESFRYL